MSNPFLEIDPEESAPEGLKQALTSEIDVIRNAIEIVRLYVDFLFPAIGAVASPSSGQPLNSNSNERNT